MGIYPDCFPHNFEECILPKDVGYTAIKGYRVAKYGVKDPRSYLSSLEERIMENSLEKKPLDLEKADSYSTSLFDQKDYPEHLLKMFLRDHPPAELAYGQTDPSCGPSKVDRKEVKKKYKDGSEVKTIKCHHINWWIYKGVEPHKFFEKENNNEQG